MHQDISVSHYGGGTVFPTVLETTKHAEAGDRAGRDENIRILEDRHMRACRELLAPAKQKPVIAGIRELIGEFQRITHGMLMLNDRPPRSVDEAIAIGEQSERFGARPYAPVDPIDVARHLVTLTYAHYPSLKCQASR